MKPKQYGPCGLYCGACAATDCNGCHSDMIDQSIIDCHFRKCSHGKGIVACCYCQDYPCAQLADFMNDKWPHHWTMQPNLEFIKNRGIDVWLTDQERTWQCSSCSAPTHWYQKNCTCGKVLEAWEHPA